ncbi:hypothetical protein CEE39_05640 [bacterium (candidate division B38) B3_B38]|nr:MAG: hypothetical protein CEE39_05640 [bacterium (candidate division B38) B3_B38]
MPADKVIARKRTLCFCPRVSLYLLLWLTIFFLCSGSFLFSDTLVFVKETVLRQSPSAESEEIAVAVKGSFYELIDETEDEVGNIWYRVRYPQTTPEGTVMVEAYCSGEGLVRSNKSMEWLQKYTLRLKGKNWTDWSVEALEKVLHGKIGVGFTTYQVLLALGEPLRLEKDIPGIEEQWVYELSYVNFEEGLVTSQTLRQPVTLPEVEVPPKEEVEEKPPPEVKPPEEKLPPAPIIRTRYGSLTLGGILQFWGWGKMPAAEETEFEFTFKRARILLWGDIGTSKIGYFLRFEGRENPFLLDAKLRLFYIPRTEIAIGRFLPDFSLYMPLLVSQLDTVNYPLVIQRYGMWHQLGIQSTTTTSFLDFTMGLFNGPPNRFKDDNSQKDYLFKVNLKPVRGLQCALYRWVGNPLLNSDEWTFANRDGINLQLSVSRLTVKAELIRGFREKLDLEGEVLSAEGVGGYANVVCQLHERAEVVFRYDFFDPNRAFSDNELYWITPGLNLHLHPDAAIVSVNYVMKREKPTEINNDLLIVQLQISF